MAVPYEKLLLCSHIFGIEYPETYVCVLIPTNFHAGVVLDMVACTNCMITFMFQRKKEPITQIKKFAILPANCKTNTKSYVNLFKPT